MSENLSKVKTKMKLFKKNLPENIKSKCCNSTIAFHYFKRFFGDINFYCYICIKCDDYIPQHQSDYLDNLNDLKDYKY